MSATHDIHSFSEPHKLRVTHCSLDLTASFEKRTLTGTARLRFQRFDSQALLLLDTRDLEIHAVRCGNHEVAYELGNPDPVLGRALKIDVPPDENSVCISYSTQAHASGLQWLTPRQTAGKIHPFLFSQNQSIHARSWIPIQDSPGVRITYDARIKAPHELRVLMSAEQISTTHGTCAFRMDLPVPAYLIGLAIGDLAFSPIGPRTGVYAEPSTLPAAAGEFSDTEKIISAVETLYGPYRWGRYDLLVLPPSFPFGGMENPLLTFVTPTIIAGDKSLVSLISHELAHSWSGNLVANATWSDFWLNEGFTTYIENRIQEEVYGREQALMEQVLDRRELEKELSEFAERDQVLHIDLTGRDPDDGTTRVPYIKGALLLRQMEQVFGRPVLDRFLTSYFAHFAFQSITTAQALDYIRTELFERYPDRAALIPLDDWVYRPGLPASAPRVVSQRMESVVAMARNWLTQRVNTHALSGQEWNTQEWLEFLQVLPHPLEQTRMAELDHAFHLTETGNYEILDYWLLMAIESGYVAAGARLESFLLEVGRLRYIKPLYAELMKTQVGQWRAREIYSRARAGYHPIAQTALDKVLSSPDIPATSFARGSI